MRSKYTYKFLLLLLLIVGHLIFSWITMVPGFMIFDEAIFYLSVKNFSETGGFEIWNGYEEFPSKELALYLTVLHKGRLVSQYPYLYSVLASPFYRVAGIYGLLWLNVLAFIGIIIFAYKSAQLLFKDRNLSINACLVFMLATYAWQYSQDIWPHILMTLVLMAAFYWCLRAFYAQNSRKALWMASLSGFLVSAAAGIRVDGILFSPCLILPFLFSVPWRPKQALTFIIGMLPGVLALSLTNYVKFGTFIPFSYGGAFFGGAKTAAAEVRYFLPSLILWAEILFGAWILTRSVVTTRLKKHKRILIISFILCCCLFVLFFRPSWRFKRRIRRQLYNAYHIVVDFRPRPWNLPEEEVLTRSLNGGVIFAGGLKKSLLQSCPYLVFVLGFSLLHVLRRQQDSETLLLLLGGALIFPIYYLYGAWHGAFCLNLRYLLPIFPCTSILAAYAWRNLRNSLNWPGRYIMLGTGTGGLFIAAMYLLKLRPAARSYTQQEFPYLSLPLRLALLLFIIFILRELLVFWFAKHRQKSSALLQIFSLVTLVSFFMTMVWAGLVEFFYDYPHIRPVRVNNWKLATQTAGMIGGDAILFAEYPPPFFGVQEDHRLRVAYPYKDNFRDFPELIAFHLKRGHEVYGAFNSQQQWHEIQQRGLLDAYEVIPIFEFEPYQNVVRQIVAKE